MAESLLEERLQWFRTLKLGLMIHWGPYSQLGCIESWPLSEEDAWARPGWQGDFAAFQRRYWALNQTFNPVKFAPEAWAELASRAGMRYLVFTTKHHDGFSMYDTRLSNYSITASDCPFHTHPQADITKHVFSAFRAQGLGIGAYYSKADWRSPYFWVPGRPATNRHPNYDPLQEPEAWHRFTEFVHGQIRELMTGYGPIDILWLDAGWVRPPQQDLNMDRIVAMARNHQPGLIVADRTVGGPHENYLTPENQVPTEPIDRPWETCLTMGDSWSFRPNDHYKSVNELIHLLVDIVAKGGNLCLNVGPDSEGNLPDEAVARLEAMGEWMEVCGEALYNSKICAPYRLGKWALTRKDNATFAFYLMDPGETTLPTEVLIPLAGAQHVNRVRLLGAAETLPSTSDQGGIRVSIPSRLAMMPPTQHACVFCW